MTHEHDSIINGYYDLVSDFPKDSHFKHIFIRNASPKLKHYYYLCVWKLHMVSDNGSMSSLGGVVCGGHE